MKKIAVMSMLFVALATATEAQSWLRGSPAQEEKKAVAAQEAVTMTAPLYWGKTLPLRRTATCLVDHGGAPCPWDQEPEPGETAIEELDDGSVKLLQYEDGVTILALPEIEITNSLDLREDEAHVYLKPGGMVHVHLGDGKGYSVIVDEKSVKMVGKRWAGEW